MKRAAIGSNAGSIDSSIDGSIGDKRARFSMATLCASHKLSNTPLDGRAGKHFAILRRY